MGRGVVPTTLRHVAAGACVLVVGTPACRVRAPERAPETTPSDPGVASDDAPDRERVRRDVALPDPRVAEQVTLPEILAYADEHSPVLLVARSTRARAEAERIAAAPRLYANPQLTVSAGPRLGGDSVGVDVDVALWQQIQVAGERKTRLAAADRFQDLTNADIERTRWEVRCDVRAAFHQALVNRDRAELAADVVAFQQEVLGVVERQMKAGETAKLSLRLAEAEAAQARQMQVAAEQAYRASRIRLAQLSGWPVDRAPKAAGEPDAPRLPPSTDELVALAKKKLPLLLARKAAIAEAKARVAVARREVWPRPSLGVQYRREDNPSPEHPYDIVLGGISLAIPSFQTNQGERARARADVHVAQAELDAATVLLDGQIAQAHSEVVAAAERVRSYGTEILPRFEENLVLLRRAFELGEIDLLALSVGRERFLRIQSDALGAQLDYFVAVTALERVVGVDVIDDAQLRDKAP